MYSSEMKDTGAEAEIARLTARLPAEDFREFQAFVKRYGPSQERAVLAAIRLFQWLPPAFRTAAIDNDRTAVETLTQVLADRLTPKLRSMLEQAFGPGSKDRPPKGR
jgi:hypothetical protein